MASPARGKIPVWLDCDPGHDDAFAILMTAHHPTIELLGISTVHGNSSVKNTTHNAASILTAMGKSDVPVYQGAAKGLVRPAVHAPDIHGESGLDGTDLLPTIAVPPILDIAATAAIAAALFSTPSKTAWLIATGAMTNMAHLFTAHPKLADHIAGFSIMGGAIGGQFTSAPLGKVDDQERFGNYSPFAEFNILCDPEAAQQVFSNEVLANKTVLIPLDVTHQVLATKEVQELLLYGPNAGFSGSDMDRGTPSTLRVMLVELLLFFASTYAEVFGITAGPPLHDPLAVAVIFDGIKGFEVPFYDYEEGDEGRGERWSVEVLTEGTIGEAIKGETQTGRTLVQLLEKGKEGVKIPRSLDVKRFWYLLEECLARADATNSSARST